MSAIYYMSTPEFLGALLDTRSAEAKIKDYKFKEIVASAAPVNWIEKPEVTWRIFPDQNQNGSGSCVAQTLKKLLGISLWLRDGIFIKFSATHIYNRRTNRPNPGMIGVEAFEIVRLGGATLEDFVKSEQLTDAQMDAAPIQKHEEDIGMILRLGNHLDLPIKDIETVASVIQQTGKGVMVWFYFLGDEWSPKVPLIINPTLQLEDSTALRHSATATDFFLWNGKKCLLIEDSAHFGGITRRIITEDFYKKRNWFAHYGMNFKFEDQSPTPTPMPNHTFTVPLLFGQTNNDIKALQDILRYEGLFPANTQSSGYYGAITCTAVLKFRTKYGISSTSDPLGRSVGPLTIAKLNQIYG